MTDSTALMAFEITKQGRGLDAIRYLRRSGLSFQTARKYVQEMKEDAPWWVSAAKRAKRARK